MINLLESNLSYKNLKNELSENFPQLSKYILSSIYTETLRGQIRVREDLKYDFKLGQKWKRLRSQSIKLEKHYKNYIIKLPNLLENICSEELNNENIMFNVKCAEKAISLLLKGKGKHLKSIHSLIFIVLWDNVGRFRTLEKSDLMEQLEKYGKPDRHCLELALKELTHAGLVTNIGDEYGISAELIL